MSLSMRNVWMDDDGHVYIYFTLEEACEQLCCKTDKAVKLFAELDSAKGVGLIRRVKQGLGRPVMLIHPETRKTKWLNVPTEKAPG